MIGYIKGTVAAIERNSNRVTLTLEVNQVGYDLQIPSRMAQQLQIGSATVVQVFTHQQIREDQMLLYGFATAAERDLFRLLIGVSGIGANLAIALLDTLGLADLVQAIVTGNTRVLSKTPGIGAKTAERLALELKTKLSQWRHSSGLTTATSGPAPAILEDVEMTLLALGYSNTEISQALQSISQDPLVAKSKQPEDWIRSAIAYLSQFG